MHLYLASVPNRYTNRGEDSMINRRLKTVRATFFCLLAAIAIANPTVSRGAENSEIIAFDIKPQPLPDALADFAEQADLDVMFDSNAPQGAISPALKGSYPPLDALAYMLEGTNLEFVFDGQRSVAIRTIVEPPTTSQAVVLSSVRTELASNGSGSSQSGVRVAQVDAPRSSAGATGGRTSVLEEITVTATKREERLIDIPVSVTAFTGEAVDRLNMTTLYDLTPHVPNLQFKEQFGVTSPIIMIRGIGNTSFFANTINPVGIYQDGVYIGQNIVQGLRLYDIERVEVLRGPQGTLFGRNTTGGLINYISRKPDVDDGTNGFVEVTVGEFGQFDVQAAGGVALGETAAARVSVFRQTKDGVFDNVNPANSNVDDGEVDTIALRGAIDWSLSDALNLYLSARYGKGDGNLRGFKPAYTTTFGFDPVCPPGGVPGEFQNGCSDPFFIGLTDAPGFHETQHSFATKEEVEGNGFTAQMDWQVGNYSVTSVTGWDTADMERFEDDDGNVLALLHDTFLADTDFFSQELRLTSNYDDRPYDWIFGLYYYTDELDTQTHFNNVDHGPGFISGAFGPPGPTPEGIGQNIHQETDSWAIFGEGNYDLTQNLTLTLGLRVTNDERSVTLDSFLFDASQVPANSPISVAAARAAELFPVITPTSNNDDWTEWSGRLALDYSFSEDSMLFASLSRGFKGGEVNGGAIFLPSEVGITDPEFVTSLEAGYKGMLFDNTLEVSITGFIMDYDDQQVLISDVASGLPILTNAGSSDINGAELEFRWQPNEAWYVSLGGAYLDAEVDSFFDPVTGADFSGNQLPEAPEWSFDGIVRYEIPAGPGTLSLQTDWYWQDSRWFVIEHTQGLRQDSYGIVNARIAYSFFDDQFRIAVIGRNLFDEDYTVNGFDSSTFGSLANIFIPGDPRSVAVQLRFNYN